MRGFNPARHYPDLLSNIRYSPGKKAVDSLERIRKRRKSKDVLSGLVDMV